MSSFDEFNLSFQVRFKEFVKNERLYITNVEPDTEE